jgi:PPM family protein phosphatase
VKARVTVTTHPGLVRRVNEDHVGVRSGGSSHGRPDEGTHLSIAPSHGPLLVVVADGLGGHPCGDVASRLVIESLLESAPADADELVVALHVANHAVYEAMDDDSASMGTTVAAVLVLNSIVVVANVGDSPVFELRDGALAELSIRDKPDGGAADWSATVTQTLGGCFGHEEITPHTREYAPRLPARLLLCTDGLTDFVSEEAVASALGEPERSVATERLVQLALSAGGGDNVTVAVLDIE